MDFNKMTIEELKALKSDIAANRKERSAEAKEVAKAEKAEAKADATETGRALAEIGKTVSFSHKGEDANGRIVKISEKTVTVVLVDNDGNDVLKNDKPAKIWKYFYQIA